MSLSKFAIIFAAVIMLSVCVAVPLAEMHNEDNVVAGDHREPVVGETSIYDYSDFQLIRDNLSGKFILMNNIVVTGNFRPIGYGTGNTIVAPFTGSFDGNGYVIDGMNVGSYDGTNYYEYAGLFAQLGTNAKVSNVGMINGSVTSAGVGDRYAGSIAAHIPGAATGVKITNCYNTGSISVSSLLANAGGIAGYIRGTSSIISNCYNTGSISASASSSSLFAYAGGIAGRADETMITNCYNTGSVSSSSSSSSNTYAGGIAGYVILGTITNCYNTGSVLATGQGTVNFGGVAGQQVSGTVDAATCFYLAGCTASGGSTYGTSKTAVQLRTESTYPTTSITYPWDFTDVWTFVNAGAKNNGLPYLKNIEDPRIFITESTGDVIIPPGEKNNQYFSVSAVSDMELTFKWQTSTDSGVTWEDDFRAGGRNTGNLSVSPLNYSGGALFRCVISNDRTEAISETMALSFASTPAQTIHYVSNAAELQWVGDGSNHGGVVWAPSDIYIQTADISLPTPAAGMSNFVPLPTFKGTYDGNGFTISNMVIATYDGTNYYQYAGLFYQLGTNAKIMNVGMVGGSIEAGSSSDDTYAGSIVANIPSGTSGVEISNCYNTGSVSASSSSIIYWANAGGIVGRADGTSLITNCYNTGSVSASLPINAYAGGIAGSVYSGTTITNCYNTGSVSASSSSSFVSFAYAGGIAGCVSGTTIINCYNTGSVSASSPSNAFAGGIAGDVYGTITNCYNTGSVTATASSNAYAGGIIGLNRDNITNCYNIGPVTATGTGTKYFGGVVGLLHSGTVDNASCFYLSTCVTSPTNTNGTSKSDGELRMGSTYPDTGTNPWDFENTWFLSPIDGYFTPHLKAFVPQIYLHPVTTATASDSVHVEPYPSVFAQSYGWQKYSAVNGWEGYTNTGTDPFTLSLASSSVGDRYRFVVDYGKLVPGDPIRRTISLETTVATAGAAYTVDASVSYRTEASGAATEGYGHIIKGGNYSVKAGSNIEFTFEAEVGHALTDVFVNGSSVFNSVLNNKYTIMSVSNNIVIEAEFSTLVDLTVAVNGLDGGDTIVMKYVVNGVEQSSTAPGIIKVPLGVEATISFTYSGTKLFQRWSGYASGLESSITFDTPTVTGNIAVTAYFLPFGTPTLTINYNGPNNDGTVEYILYKGGAYDSSGIIPFAGGTFTFPTESTDTIYLTAFNGTDDVFQAWSGVPYADLLSTSISVTAISTPSVITAYFVDSSSDTVTINNNIPNGDGRIAYILYKNGTNVAYGSIPMSSGTFTIHMESTDTIDLAADDGMNDIFQRWADDILGLTSNLSTIDRSISPSVASGSVSVTAYFVDASSSNVMTINYSGPNNDGTVGYILSKSGTSVASGDIPFAGGTFTFLMESTDTIDLTAVDGTDDIFQRWANDIWNPASDLDSINKTIVVSAAFGSVSVTAYFVDASLSELLTLNYSGVSNDGAIIYILYKNALPVASGQIIFANNVFYIPMGLKDTIDLTAVNGTDDTFQRWIDTSGEYNDTLSSISISDMIGPLDITARFVSSIGHSEVKITYEWIVGGEVWYGFGGISHEGLIRFTGGVAFIVLGTGEDVILSAENDTARFLRWMDNIGSTYSVFTKDVTVNGSADISVIFVNFPVETLRIVANADNNSTISPEGTNVVSPGNSMTFTFSANPGYRISKVIVDGYEVQASGTYTFSDVRSSHTISVLSERDAGRLFTVTVDHNEGLGYIEMSVNGSPFARYDGSITVTEGSSVVLKATPTGDNSFGGWTGTIRSSDQELRITNVSGNVSEQANFKDNGSFPILWIAIIIIVVIAAIIIAFFVIRSSRSKD